MVASLVAGSIFTKQLLWTPIEAINMNDIVTKQFKMSGAAFVGTDKNGQPFKINAKIGYQEYENPDIIFMETVSGAITRDNKDTNKITDNITANTGQYNRAQKTITLIGNVHVDSSNGDKIRTKELVIKLWNSLY